MRPLAKTPMPQILVQRGDQWRGELLAVLAQGGKPTEAMKSRYRHPQIKDALIDETDGKCAYCESKLRHITHGDIEHIVPKSKVPAKAYEWENLTLACDVCNENKGDTYSDDPALSQDALVDPYIDVPEDHFLFCREVVTPRPDSMRGLATEQVIKLTRNALVERRRERMNFIDGLVRAVALAAPEYKDLLIQDLNDNHLKTSDEFYAASHAYVTHLKSIGAL